MSVRIASISKPFIAVAVLHLAERQKLELSRGVSVSCARATSDPVG